MKHFKSTIQAFCLLLPACLFSTPLAAQSRGGGETDTENVPHIETEVGWGSALIDTGVEHAWSYPVTVSGSTWVEYSESESAAKNTICLRVLQNDKYLSRECEVVVADKESRKPLVVVSIVQQARPR